MQKIILYQDLESDNKKYLKLKDKLQTSRQDIMLINTCDLDDPESILDSPEAVVNVYLMGQIECPWANANIVGIGPHFNELKDEKSRTKLLKDVGVDSDVNLFNNYSAFNNYSVPTASSASAVKIDLDSTVRPIGSYQLNDGNIDEAISALKFCQNHEISFTMPELKCSIGKEAQVDQLAYEEFISLLIVLKRFGAVKFEMNIAEVTANESDN